MTPPMPSPDLSPYISTCCKNGINSSDISPPVISILTDRLYEGNNVLKLKILDESPLKMRAVSYNVEKNNITTYLAKEHNNEYPALLKGRPPHTIIEVTAIDLNNNYAKLVKEFKVEKGVDKFFSIFVNNSIWKNLISGDSNH